MKPHLQNWRDISRLSQYEQEQLEERAAIKQDSGMDRESAEQEAIEEWNDQGCVKQWTFFR